MEEYKPSKEELEKRKEILKQFLEETENPTPRNRAERRMQKYGRYKRKNC